ncbi:MAG: twin-arginine translocation signal domain-containing protein [Chloroflexi bacterium]|nr:twin-arginine translocation signal domain-containing protein [Chloroflexota bacterium]
MLGRRDFLKGLALGGGAVLLGACAPDSSPALTPPLPLSPLRSLWQSHTRRKRP